MGRKDKAKESADPVAKAPDKEVALPPISGGLVDSALLAAAAITVAFVGWWFHFEVNRVFDVPKAFALKVGGGGVFLVWLLYGLFGKGFPWKSMRLFAAPVFALLSVVGIGTLLSLDPWMSLHGVYERQFGFHGLVACVGLFVVTATCFRSRRGAVLGLATLLIVGGVIGGYAFLQSAQLDPWGFKQPLNKVYATLGNATFAGNALALIFPVSAALAFTAAARSLPKPGEGAGRWIFCVLVGLIGVAIGIGLVVGPAWLGVDQQWSADDKQLFFKAGVALLILGLGACGAIGSFGPSSLRAETEDGRLMADRIAAGILVALVIGIGAGLLATRTRGAWVGTVVAIVSGLILLPIIFRDSPKAWLWSRVVCWGLLLAALGGFQAFMTLKPDHLYARTIKSIPHAFDPEHTVYGQGQGTRRYLWAESPRVLFNHEATLERQETDRIDRLKQSGITDVEKEEPSAVRKGLVWLFGIGIETYRYAFMSHKSKELEALDPMTNHDNPHNNYLYLLASCGILGLAAYLWLLWRLVWVSFKKFIDRNASRGERAIAFGVVTSFVSYSVYSLAGFDSVACSVFLYFLLGSAAAFFEPNHEEPRRPILLQVRRQWAEWRGREIPLEQSMPAAIFVAIAGVMLLSNTVLGVMAINAAEKAFVSRGEGRQTFQDRIDSIKKAIELNPRESFYWQTLGGVYADASRQYREAANRAQQQNKTAEANGYLTQAREMFKEAETALYKSLDHAWAPENIFISMFQLYYSWQRPEQAERALERALEHSPHLGPVRANLAVIEEQRGAYQEALADCLWVLEVEPSNGTALRTCGRSYQKTGDLQKAQDYLNRAQAASPKDPVLQKYIDELKKDLEAKNSTTSSTPPT